MSRFFVVLVAVSAAVACLNPLPVVEPPGDGGLRPPDAGQVDAGAAIAVEGCQYIGALNRIGFRGEVTDAGPCITLLLVEQYGTSDGGGPLKLPPGWEVESASAQTAACDLTWQGTNRIGTGDIRGYVRFPGDGGGYPSSASLDVTLRFDGGPGQVRMAGGNVSLNASCLP